MAPDNLSLRIQSLLHIQLPQANPLKHPFLHLIGWSAEKEPSITTNKTRDHSAAHRPKFICSLGNVAKEMLTLSSPSKNQMSTTDQKINPNSNMQFIPSSDMTPFFVLPQLTPVNISLTDGTDIPPPPESPAQETPPLLEECQSMVTDEICPPSLTTNSVSSQEVDEETTIPEPPSPARNHTKHPNRLRKFFSRRSLHPNCSNDTLNLPRPDSSRSYISANTSLSSGQKRSVSWLGRFSGDGGTRGFLKKRASVLIEEKELIVPSVAMLPELSQFKANISEINEGLGEDLFKNIK